MKLKFCGAAGTVTGSRYLLTQEGRQFLLDCGLFQGLKQLRLRNWAEPPFESRKVSKVLLTHAHIDHSGYLPLLVRKGFKGQIVCTRSTAELCKLLLRDSAHLQEEEARYANRKGYSRHRPALPLYNLADAEKALDLLAPVEFGEPISVVPGVSAEFLPAGHILGSAMIMVSHDGRKTLFSGDLGRPNDPVMKPPQEVTGADNLVLESTYGNRTHDGIDPEASLGANLNRALERGGMVIIPAFAVGRVQSLLLIISRLKGRKQLPDVPVYLNSPMAVDATRLYHEFRSEHRLSEEECRSACSVSRFINSVEESIELNRSHGPGIIISASGMATGGRVVHHIKAFAPDPKNMILFAGFQAAGTRGAALVGGAKWVRIHGEDIPVAAEVVNVDAFSAHADAGELIHWMRRVSNAPGQVFLTHGEPSASSALKDRIKVELGWDAKIAEDLQEVVL